MRVTRKQLRQMINEELLREADDVVSYEQAVRVHFDRIHRALRLQAKRQMVAEDKLDELLGVV